VRVLGIDEAGRGCVLGPLSVASYLVEVDREPALWEAGAADSKTLTHARRIEVRARLAAIGTATVRLVEPSAIDAGNMNHLEEAVIADLVREARPDRVVIDALGHPKTLPAVCARLQDMVGPSVRPQWIMEPKADANHATVAAASIFAKTTRDAALAVIDAEFGPVGSGYPSDPETKAWLAAWSASRRPWPHFVRTRWQTIDNLAQQSMF